MDVTPPILMMVVMGWLFVAWGPLFAQTPGPDNPVRQRALEAFHGSDGTGKDGPMAKASFELVLLYYRWEAHTAASADTAFAPEGTLPVRDEHVTIDATAAQGGAALHDRLEALGLTNGAQAGAVVSGRLPIAAIPEAAQLPELRAMRPARAQTHGSASSASPDTVSPPSRDDSAAQDTTASAGTEEDTIVQLTWIGAVAVLIVGLLFFWLGAGR